MSINMSEAEGAPVAGENPPDGCAALFVAIFGASVFASLLITIGAWAGFMWAFYWLILSLTLFVATVIGIPLFLAAWSAGRANAWTAAAGGFVTAAALPALFILPIEADAWTKAAGIAAFGMVGAGAGLVFLLILRWDFLSAARRRAMAALAMAPAVIAFCAGWAAQDHSCHNPVWYGQGIAPSGSFELALPAAEWRKLAAEIDGFARERGWSVRTDAAFEPKKPWFRMSVCEAAGTDIEVSQDGGNFGIHVYQPQGGDSWQPPMRALHARLAARWPDTLRYTDELGAPTPRPPKWLAATAPPAAPSAPSRRPPGSRP